MTKQRLCGECFVELLEQVFLIKTFYLQKTYSMSVDYKKSKIRLRSRMTIDTAKSTKTMDSVKYIKDGKREIEVLMRAQSCYDALYEFRENSRRNYRYVIGDQWGDEIVQNGCKCKERDSIVSQGNVPLTNNMLNRLVRTLVGVWRKQNKRPACSANDPDEQGAIDQLTVALKSVFNINDKKELDAEGLIRFLITGWAMQKVVWDYKDGSSNVWISNIPNFEYAFWDTNMVDSRGWDMGIIGEIHDITFGELCRTFAHSKQDYAKLDAIYRQCSEPHVMREYNDRMWSGKERHSADFYTPKDSSLCRVIEVWTKERKPKYLCQDWAQEESDKLFEIEEKDKPMYDLINSMRIEKAKQWNKDNPDAPISLDDVALIEMNWVMSEYWYVRYLSPFGDVLDEMESPFEHGEHPYIMKLYPFTNGEVHSFVADLIDQQRYINRLISVNDKLLLSAAKGILLFPMSLVPEGKTPEQIQKEWTQSNAVMFYDDKANPASMARPEQVANRLTNIGTADMLQLQMNILEESSGVNSALQGKPGFSGQSAALYAQQTQNSSVSVLDLLESYNSMITNVARKVLKLIQQYYTEKRMLVIAGSQEPVMYDPELCGDVDADVTLYDGDDTPDADKVSKELLTVLLNRGDIDGRQFVELGDWSYKQRVIRAMEQTKQVQQEMMAQQQGQQGGHVSEAPQENEVPQGYEGMVDTGSVAQHNAERILRNNDLLSPEEATKKMQQQ